MMYHYKSAAIAGLIAMLGAMPGNVAAQDGGHGTHTGQGMMDHGQMMKGMSDGGSSTGEADPHDHDGGAEATGSPATEAYRAANRAMHEAMDLEFTGDADIDFALGMIGHHQGAIDMARVVLEHGDDPELRQLAEEVIATQEEEIAFLRDWISRNGE